MSQPVAYTRSFNFAQYAALHTDSPYAPADLDVELDGIEATLADVLANIALIQRDDGALANGIVTPDSLDQATINMIGEWTPRGAWVTATNYAVRDMVTPTGGTLSYVCATAHTSGATFAGDLALGYWQPVNGAGSAAIVAANITFSATDRILGRATAGAGAGEEITCTAAARALLDDASAAAMRTTLGLGSTDDPTFSDVFADTISLALLAQNGFTYISGASKVLASTAAATDGQVLIGRTGSTPIAATITGTVNQVTVTNGGGSITLSLPQSIATTSSPTFANGTFSGQVGIGTSPSSSAGLSILPAGTLSGTSQFAALGSIIGTSAGTDFLCAFDGVVQTAAAAYTCTFAASFIAPAATKGAGSTITNEVGFLAFDRTAGALNIGFMSLVNAASTSYAFLGSGTAQSQFGGDVNIASQLTNGQLLRVKSATTLLATPAGATVTATNLIPAGSLVLGVTIRVTTTVTGPASFNVGDGTTANKWGNAVALPAGTTTTIANFLAAAASPTYYLAATGVVLTAVGGGGAFTGGAVRITVHYISLDAATS